MKKIFLVFFIVIIIVFVVVFDFNKDDEIRVRIIPNSNSEEDQGIKAEVKSDIIIFLCDNFDSNRKKFINNMNNNLSELKSSLINKYNKDIKVSLENHIFTNKIYNNNVISNKECLTLLVVIEEGIGSNWWGSIYPNLLGVESSNEVEYKSFFKRLIERIL